MLRYLTDIRHRTCGFLAATARPLGATPTTPCPTTRAVPHASAIWRHRECDTGVPARPGPWAPAATDARFAGSSDDETGRSSSGAAGESKPGTDGRDQRPGGQSAEAHGRTPADSESADRVRQRVPHGRLRSYVVTGGNQCDASDDAERPGQAPADTATLMLQALRSETNPPT
jgi:hypothetical protein